MTWKPNAATLRLQAIKAGKNTREAETKPAKSDKTTQKSDQKPAHSGKKPNKSSKKRMKQVAKKRARELRKYGKLRKKFLADHPTCEIPVEGCTFTSTEVHHGEGRENGRLLDVTKFKAACHNCHRVATDKSKEAITAGRSGSRLGKSKRNGKTDIDTNLPG